ncbi:hypothetical protein [Streptomyces sp. H27-C3]|uniref:hypothetical protein n=1 Tax=Streptomyces sp. H27-C3 TaxID=3046305 RepID=UPI0024B8A0D9|nr:hypothetical protein [Streptomyces sp. H27-C3]MDJ0460641.1 hypothetical protein [Streptomyces sp. H27-C3]
MFGAKTRHIADLESRVQQLADERDDARTAAAAHLGAATRTAERATHLSERLELSRDSVATTAADVAHAKSRLAWALRTCACYRVQNAALARQVAHLQARLDAAVGLDAPNIALGASWQTRRTDKPSAVKP